MSQRQTQILLIGVEARVRERLAGILGDHQTTFIDSAEAFCEAIDKEWVKFDLAFAGPGLEGVSNQEIAQSARSKLQGAKFFYCSENRGGGFERANYIKNGFDEAFMLPFDADTLKREVEDALGAALQRACYRSVKLLDLQPGTNFDFDIHVLLPQNRKYVKYVSSGNELEDCRLKKLKENQIGSLYVDRTQMHKFYDYSAQRLLALNQGQPGVSETDRRKNLENAVRSLVTGIFSTREEGGFEAGKEMLEDASKIVDGFVRKTEQGNFYSKVLGVIEDSADSSSHLSSVATLASLFSMVAGVGKPEEIAIAALFHDLGLSEIPAEVAEKAPSLRTPEEQEIFEKHPLLTIRLLQEKRVSLPASMQTWISQHHERFMGKGFPLRLSEPRLLLESQVLGLADEFEYRTRFKPDGTFVRPERAMADIAEERLFNPILVKKLTELFAQSPQPGEEKSA